MNDDFGRMQFEWDSENHLQNQSKRRVSFDETSTVFGDPFALTIDARTTRSTRSGFVTTGYSNRQGLIIVAHTDRDERVRIVNAREVTAAERRV